MNDKQINILAGLPRAGTTVIGSLLNQNPNFYASATSGILDILLAIRNQWENVELFQSAPNPEGKDAVLKGILHNYYSTKEESVIFDKCRAWTNNIELAEFVTGKKIKIIYPVRNITDILTSFEVLHRKNVHNYQSSQEKFYPELFQTTGGRADIWMKRSEAVGASYNHLYDVFNKGMADRLLIVEYEDLINHTADVMAGIYNFIEQPHFNHDFNNIVNVTEENDSMHGIPGLHDIRNKISHTNRDALEYLGQETFDKYSNFEFWRKV